MEIQKNQYHHFANDVKKALELIYRWFFSHKINKSEKNAKLDADDPEKSFL